jgi:Helix-turn-helix of DDE superfamily endonuclease
MTLEYWREYRTQFHIGVSWGLDETNVLRNVRKVENILIKSGLFNVEGKKKVKELDSEIEVVVVDATEHEVERPKKSGCNRAEVSSACVAPSNRKDIIAVSKSAIQ